MRAALGDAADNPRFIETLERRGYRFIAPVATPDAPAPAGSASLPESTSPKEPDNRRVAWLGGVVAAAAVLVAVWIAFGPELRRRANPEGRVAIRSLAVLPLANLTGDPAQEYFSDGMTDALITNLASFPDLRVTSRQSVMRYKGSAKPLAEIARELGVEGVVEGSVVRSAGRVRVTAQLIHAATDRHLWAHGYERRLEDVLVLQGELSRAIAEEIRITVGTKENRRLTAARTVKPEAYDAYLLGRHHWDQRTEESLARALAYFQAAIATDPDFALAHAGLALAYAPRLIFGYLPPGRGLSEQKAAALRPWSWTPASATRAPPWPPPVRRSGIGTERRPNSGALSRPTPAPPSGISGTAGISIRSDASTRAWPNGGGRSSWIPSMARSTVASPETWPRPAGTRRPWRTGSEFSSWSRVMRRLNSRWRSSISSAGAPALASRHLERARSFGSGDPSTLAFLAIVSTVVGDRQEGRRILGQLKAESARRYISPVLLALVHVALDEKDTAFALLEDAYAAKDPMLIPIQVCEAGPFVHLPKERAGRPARRSAIRRSGAADGLRPGGRAQINHHKALGEGGRAASRLVDVLVLRVAQRQRPVAGDELEPVEARARS